MRAYSEEEEVENVDSGSFIIAAPIMYADRVYDDPNANYIAQMESAMSPGHTSSHSVLANGWAPPVSCNKMVRIHSTESTSF